MPPGGCVDEEGHRFAPCTLQPLNTRASLVARMSSLRVVCTSSSRSDSVNAAHYSDSLRVAQEMEYQEALEQDRRKEAAA